MRPPRTRTAVRVDFGWLHFSVSGPCDRDNDERIAATAAVTLYLREIVGRVFPEADAEAMATATWALVHGLAFLHLDGKLDASTPSAVADRVTAAVDTLLGATSLARPCP
jgi:hypothetical protein